MISLYDSAATDFNNNGLVVLSNCKSFFTIENLNGMYEIEFDYPLDDSGKWQNILEGNIIKNSDGQLFRIYHKSKSLEGIKANARHIFYDLLDNFLEDVRPTNLSGIGALTYILSQTQYAHLFTAIGDVGGSNTKYFVKKNPVEAIMGQDGIIANWGGELVRDNFTISLFNARGLDRGVLISYGKNIIGIDETIDLDSVITRIFPTGKDGIELPEKYIDSPYISNYPNPKIKEVQFSDLDNETDLRATAQAYFIASKCDIPSSNYAIDFVELSKTVEYSSYAVLETVYLGDTVTVRHSKLSMDLKCKVISIKKNDITGRIEKIELGNFKPNLANSFSNITNMMVNLSAAIIETKSDWQTAVNDVTTLLTSTLGGYVIKEQNQILIMDTTDKMTAVKVWRWNLNGLGYSDTGINGTYTTAITMDGHIVASFITGLVITGNQIIGGTLTLGGANNGNGVLKLKNAVGNSVGTFDSTGVTLLQGLFQIVDAVNDGTYDSYTSKNELKTNGMFLNYSSSHNSVASEYASDHIKLFATYTPGGSGVNLYLGIDSTNSTRDTIFTHDGVLRITGKDINNRAMSIDGDIEYPKEFRMFSGDQEMYPFRGSAIVSHYDTTTQHNKLTLSVSRMDTVSPFDIHSVAFSVDTDAGVEVNGNKVYHAGNDGVGSGLDADLFQGLTPSAFGTAAQMADALLAFTYLMTPHLSAWDTPNDLNLITKTSIYTFDYTLSANCPCNYGTVLTLPSAWTVQIAIASDNTHIYTRTAYGTWRTI
jgi:phage minor structural protein